MKMIKWIQLQNILLWDSQKTNIISLAIKQEQLWQILYNLGHCSHKTCHKSTFERYTICNGSTYCTLEKNSHKTLARWLWKWGTIFNLASYPELNVVNCCMWIHLVEFSGFKIKITIEYIKNSATIKTTSIMKLQSTI